MKKNLCIALCWSFCLQTFCQGNEDSALLANSEKWKVQQKKGPFGPSKPGFGPYTTLAVGKYDSAVTKKKHKDGSYTGMEISGDGIDMDQLKLMTIEKTKFYRLQLVTTTDTTEAVFAISSESKEQRQTFLGKMLSKNDEGKDMVLNYNRNVPGIIKTGIDSTKWSFFIENFTSGSRANGGHYLGVASISGGYLKSEHDSLYLQTYSSFSADLILINTRGEHLAALAFKQKPITAWIRNDLEASYKKAIAALFAVIISIKDL